MFTLNKKILVTLSICFLILPLKNLHAAAPESYGFPIQDPLVATALSTGNTTDVKYETLFIEPKPERRNFPLLKNRNKIELELFLQNKEAPLAFIVPGFGGDGHGGNALFLAGELYKMGYHAVTVPDPLSWTYVVGRSDSALPGYLPRDSKEFYTFLQEVVTLLKNQRQVKISGYSVLGYSFGGLLTGYLALEDSTQHVFNFDKVVIINPAIDVAYGVNVLDELYAAGDQFTQEHKDYILGGLQVEGLKLLKKGVTPAGVMALLKKVGIKTAEEKWIIGQSFRSDLSDIVFTGQQVHDLGILKIHADEHHMNAREAEASRVSFEDYLLKFVLPSVLTDYYGGDTDTDAQTILDSTNFYKLGSLLKSNNHIFVMDNNDDLLIQNQDKDFFKSNLGDRFYLYPHGGHVGNLAFPKNLQDLRHIILN